MGQQSFLPGIDQERTQSEVEAAFEKYRLYKFLTFEEREAKTTAIWSDSPRSFTGTTTDQTASIAIHNVDTPAARREYCERIERIVRRLPRMEKFLYRRKVYEHRA
ncbi:ArpU family phage packaging/lysis transcriptional regulator [Paenibacillus jamilae]|uniref:ArpU family phage packaging/lysis transcriptional regulator n=1 Tax=Paenibacillus jamilae TaxID=114136 RepID=UPI003D2D460A